MGRLVKSFFWLVGSSVLGYSLLLLTTPNDQTITKNYPDGNSEVLKKRQAFLDTLQAAANSKEPMYKQTKSEIEKQISK